MPAVQAPATVLVTGASGFVAAQVVSAYVKAGFTVRGTVRSAAKGEYIKNLVGDKFSYVIVEDIAAPGAFDEAAKGVDVIAHTASPFHFTSVNPDDYYIPAIQGTVGVLETASRTPSVKRVVITGSAVAAWQPQPSGYVYTEKDWNTNAGEVVKEKGGAAAGPGLIYFASKYFAETAAFDFVKKNEGKISFDIVTLCPPWIFGPPIQEIKDVSSLNASTATFRQTVLDPATKSSKDELIYSQGSLSDVRDVADAHVLATTTPEAANERFLISSGAFSWQQILDAVNAAGIKANVGFAGEPIQNPLIFDGSKATRLLGLKYRDVKTIAADTAKQIVERWGNPQTQ